MHRVLVKQRINRHGTSANLEPPVATGDLKSEIVASTQVFMQHYEQVVDKAKAAKQYIESIYGTEEGRGGSLGSNSYGSASMRRKQALDFARSLGKHDSALLAKSLDSIGTQNSRITSERTAKSPDWVNAYSPASSPPESPTRLRSSSHCHSLSDPEIVPPKAPESASTSNWKRSPGTPPVSRKGTL